MMLAVRGVGRVLAATVKLIVVVPVPLAGTPVIHVGTALLVQPHAAGVVAMLNELDPPDAVAVWLVGFNEKLHAGACETVNV